MRRNLKNLVVAGSPGDRRADGGRIGPGPAVSPAQRESRSVPAADRGLVRPDLSVPGTLVGRLRRLWRRRSGGAGATVAGLATAATTAIMAGATAIMAVITAATVVTAGMEAAGRKSPALGTIVDTAGAPRCSHSLQGVTNTCLGPSRTRVLRDRVRRARTNIAPSIRQTNPARPQRGSLPSGKAMSFPTAYTMKLIPAMVSSHGTATKVGARTIVRQPSDFSSSTSARSRIRARLSPHVGNRPSHPGPPAS